MVKKKRRREGGGGGGGGEKPWFSFSMAATLNLKRDGSRGSNGSYASSSSSNSSSSSRDGGGPQLPPPPSCAASLVHGSSCSNNHNHSTRNNNNKAHSQRLLLVGGPQQQQHQQQRHQYPFASTTTATTTTTSASSQHLVKPQTEQLSSSVDSEDPVSSFLNPAGLQIDVQSDMGSLQESDGDGDDDEEEVEEEDDEPDESSNHHRVPNFARQHHGAMMEHGRMGHVHDASSTLADIFRCFICLGKVCEKTNHILSVCVFNDKSFQTKFDSQNVLIGLCGVL